MRHKYEGRNFGKRLRLSAALLLRSLLSTWPMQKLLASLRTEDVALGKYDRLAGEYVDIYENAESTDTELISVRSNETGVFLLRDVIDAQIRYIAHDVLGRLDPSGKSLLEVGAGELTTLVPVTKELGELSSVSALELSWSRMAVGRHFARKHGVEPEILVAGTATDLPFVDNAFDLVLTVHCLEQVPLDKDAILSELYRVAAQYVVLIEPSWELGHRFQKRRLEAQHYVRGLDVSIRKLGMDLIRHELLPHASNPDNRPAVYVIRKKQADVQRGRGESLACPRCKGLVKTTWDVHFCMDCGRAYPILGGIPCMHPSNGILAARYPEFGRGMNVSAEK